jgi:hypothetical protein
MLNVFGCSFLSGYGLKRNFSLDSSPTEATSSTYPAFLSKEMQVYAEPGNSNQKNLRLLEAKILEGGFPTCLIGLTFPSRIEYYKDGKRGKYLEASMRNSHLKGYFNSTELLLEDTLQRLCLLQDNCKLLIIKNAPFDGITDRSRFLYSLLKKSSCFSLDNDKTDFHTFSITKGYPTDNTSHPLEEAHAAYYEYLKNNTAICDQLIL